MAPMERSARVSPAATQSGRGREGVAITTAVGADAAQIASAHGASLRGQASWRCATLVPGDCQSAGDLLAAVAADPQVRTAELSVPVEIAEMRQQSFSFDDGLGSAATRATQPSAGTLGLDAAHAVSRGAGVLVAIVDTGADLTHPALANRIVGGWDFIQNDADPSEAGDGVDNDGDGYVDEGLGHGTHVAGIVNLAAPDARLLVVRVLDGEGRGDMLDVARGIRLAVANGARVINLSLGSLTRSDAVLLALTEASDAGAVCVTSAGNWGSYTPVEFPASYGHYAVAVAAVDANNVAAPFTSYGDFVEICAPGVGVRSTFVGGGYALWSGTSMSAPFVSGGAALVLSLHPGWTRPRVMDRLQSTTRKISQAGFRSGLGAGALDLGAAMAVEAPVVVTGGVL